MKKHRNVAYFWLLVNTLCWGAALIIVKPSLEVTTPVRFLWYRFILASFFSLPFLVYYLRKVKRPGQAIKTVVLVELLGTALALPVLYTGLALTSAIEASLIGTTGPIFVIVGGILFLREKQTNREWQGLWLALAGTLILAVVPLIESGSLIWMQNRPEIFSQQPQALLGNFLIIVYNCLTAIYYLLAKKKYHRLPKLFVSSVSFWVGVVAFAILSWVEIGFALPALANHISLDLQSLKVWIAAGYMGFFGSVIGLTAYIKGQDGVEASEASLFWYLQPLVYLPLGVVVLGEQIGIIQVVGLVLVLAGVIWASKR